MLIVLGALVLFYAALVAFFSGVLLGKQAFELDDPNRAVVGALLISGSLFMGAIIIAGFYSRA